MGVYYELRPENTLPALAAKNLFINAACYKMFFIAVRKMFVLKNRVNKIPTLNRCLLPCCFKMSSNHYKKRLKIRTKKYQRNAVYGVYSPFVKF